MPCLESMIPLNNLNCTLLPEFCSTHIVIAEMLFADRNLWLNMARIVAICDAKSVERPYFSRMLATHDSDEVSE